MHLSLEKKAGYVIPTMTYYPHNGWLKDYITSGSTNISKIPSCGL